ncbi:MAG: hypothetical protein LBD27_06010 [Tannerella sp.]|nr:hypothetical protein [Tannerella sp.]
MKTSSNKLFFLLITIALVLAFLHRGCSPEKFRWQPTFSKYDRQPFGSYVFDDVLSSSVGAYEVTDRTFFQLYEDCAGWETDEVTDDSQENVEEDEEEEEDDVVDEVRPLPDYMRQAYLVTETDVTWTETDIHSLLNLLKSGNKVMLCLTDFPAILCDTIGFRQHSILPYRSIVDYAQAGYHRDMLYLNADTLLSPKPAYNVYPHMHPSYLTLGFTRNRIINGKDSAYYTPIRCDSAETLVCDKHNRIVAMRLSIGPGELFLISTPLMFTNYGILDGDNASYAFRLLSYLDKLPLTRIEAYGIVCAHSSSPLRYLLSRLPLRWALYAALITLILYMVFTARRRQRVIPVIRQPVNETLRFTQMIGNLYYRRKAYKDLLNKKYLYFCAEVKRLNGLDLQSGEPDQTLCMRLAEKAGLDLRDMWPLYRELKYLLRNQTAVDEDAMMRHINRINEWMRRLRGENTE